MGWLCPPWGGPAAGTLSSDKLMRLLRLPAIGDLLSRYTAAFRQAWSVRQQLATPTLAAHEAEFLPAALALRDTPLSPAPRAAIWLLIAFALLALLWAAFGEIDIVATAQGKIVPNDRTKTVQPLEAATVKAIHVSDGQAVLAGQALIELDATGTDADIDRLAADYAMARLQAARAQALLEATRLGRGQRLSAIPGVAPAELAEAQALLDGHLAELNAKLARIDADSARREAELRSTGELVRKLEQTAPIAQRRAEDLLALTKEGYLAQHSYLEKEQARIEQEGDLAHLRSRLTELRASLVEARQQRLAQIAETRRLALDSYNEAAQKRAALEQELIKAEARGRLMTLTAPVDGTVQQLAVHTVGGVVTPAQALMMIVPRDYPLEIEAFLENKDVGFVEPGQEAEVKVETFPYTRYGTLHAKVSQVSGDAIADEKRGLVYAARVKMEKARMDIDGKTLSLAPGMAVSVEIKTGRRRVAEYFLSPLLQYKHDSLKER